MLALVGLAVTACPKANPPVVSQQTFSTAPGSTRIVAVMPFYPRPELQRYADVDGDSVANMVSTYVAEALKAEGIKVVAPSDLALAFTNEGHATPRRDPRAAAEGANRNFGATSVVLGEVSRWRDRDGANLGSGTAASVAYQFSLYEAPGGRRLWTSRFDHTQRTLTADPLTARKYPGGGTRWLTAAELARWGAKAAAQAMVEGQWRASK